MHMRSINCDPKIRPTVQREDVSIILNDLTRTDTLLTGPTVVNRYNECQQVTPTTREHKRPNIVVNRTCFLQNSLKFVIICKNNIPLLSKLVQHQVCIAHS